MNPWILMICSYLFRIRSSKCSTLPDINHTNPAAHRYKPQDKASKVIAVPGSRHHGEFGSWPCGHFWRQSCLRCFEIFLEKMEIYGNIANVTAIMRAASSILNYSNSFCNRVVGSADIPYFPLFWWLVTAMMTCELQHLRRTLWR